jgi:hypothetical protein
MTHRMAIFTALGLAAVSSLVGFVTTLLIYVRLSHSGFQLQAPASKMLIQALRAYQDLYPASHLLRVRRIALGLTIMFWVGTVLVVLVGSSRHR